MPLPRDLDAEQGTLKQKWEATAPQTAKSCRTQSEIIRGRRLLFSLWEQKENTIPPASGFPVDLLREKKSSNSWIIQMVYSRLLVGLVQSENQMFLVTGLEVRSLGMTPPRSQEPWRPNWLCTETLREQRPGWRPAWSSTHHRTKEVQTYSLTWTYPLVNVYKKLWKDPPFFMGKLTISMAMFNSYFDKTRGYMVSGSFMSFMSYQSRSLRIPHFWTMNQRGFFFYIFTIWNNIMCLCHIIYNVHITIYILYMCQYFPMLWVKKTHLSIPSPSHRVAPPWRCSWWPRNRRLTWKIPTSVWGLNIMTPRRVFYGLCCKPSILTSSDHGLPHQKKHDKIGKNGGWSVKSCYILFFFPLKIGK